MRFLKLDNVRLSYEVNQKYGFLKKAVSECFFTEMGSNLQISTCSEDSKSLKSASNFFKFDSLCPTYEANPKYGF